MSDDPQQINVATFTSLNDLIGDLLSENHKKNDILNAIQDIDLRFAWQCGSRCRIFSRKLQQWTDGEVIDIVIDNTTNKELLTVKYIYGRTAIQRFSSALKPIEMDDDYRCNEVIIDSILKKVKGSKGDNKKKSISLVIRCIHHSVCNHLDVFPKSTSFGKRIISSLNMSGKCIDLIPIISAVHTVSL